MRGVCLNDRGALHLVLVEGDRQDGAPRITAGGALHLLQRLASKAVTDLGATFAW